MKIAFFSFLSSFVLAYAIMRFFPRVAPSNRCSHDTPTPTGGGLSFLVAVIISCICFKSVIPIPCLLALVLLGSVSLYDDLYGLSYKVRLFCHFLCALAVIGSGLHVEMPLIQNLWGINYLLTVTLVVGLINACNFFDGLDGLLSGCVILLLFSSWLMDFHDLLKLWLVLGPSLFAFFLFNFPKAKIFMGDVGSTCIGFLLAILSLQMQSTYNFDSHNALIHKGLVYTLTPMMFVWFDILFGLLRRVVEGRSIIEPGRDYLFHQLHDFLESHKRVSLIYYMTVIFMGILSALCYTQRLPFLAGAVIYFIAQISFLIWILKRHRKWKNHA